MVIADGEDDESVGDDDEAVCTARVLELVPELAEAAVFADDPLEPSAGSSPRAIWT